MWDSKPAILADALSNAPDKEAGMLLSQGYALGPPTAFKNRKKTGTTALNPQFQPKGAGGYQGGGSQGGGSQTSRPNKLVSWNCGEQGHFKRDCPNPRREPPRDS